MQTSGIKIDLSSKDFLIENSEKIQKVIKFAVKQAVSAQKKSVKPDKAKKSNK